MRTRADRAPSTPGVAPMTKVGLGAGVRAEISKVTSTRLWWILLVGMAGYMAFLAAVLGFSLVAGGSAGLSDAPVNALAPLDVALSVYTLAPTLGYVFPLILGALAMTSEVRHRTVTSTYLGQPRRGLVVLAKLIVQCALGALVGVAGVLATLATGATVFAIAGEPTMLGSSQVWASAGWSVVALAAWSVIGVGVGTLISNQVAAIVAILAFTQFVEPILRVALSAVGSLAEIAKFLPGAAAEALVGSSLYSASGMLDLLSRGQGGVVLLGYAAVLAVCGALTTVRRDVS